MKKLFIAITSLVVILSACNQNPPQQNNVSIESSGPAGFDVNKLAAVVKTSTDPQTLEKAINNPSSKINNLDLDKDGNVDYLKVEELDNNRLKVVDNVSPSDSVTVARIKVDPTTNNTADLSVTGNPQYVGDNNYYHSSFSLTDMLLMSYFLRPHPYYMPMYHYGYYPSYYTHYRTVTTFRPSTSSAMSSRTYNRSSLSRPTGSQRSFGTRNSSTVRSGGFGRSSSSGSSFGRSSSSGSSFGRSSSGRSSFGRSRGFGRRR